MVVECAVYVALLENRCDVAGEEIVEGDVCGKFYTREGEESVGRRHSTPAHIMAGHLHGFTADAGRDVAADDALYCRSQGAVVESHGEGDVDLSGEWDQVEDEEEEVEQRT